MLPTMEILKSLSFFILVGLCEISGGYLIWPWLRYDKIGWLGPIGPLARTIYGIILTFQPANFDRAYAAYDCIFIGLSIIWGWHIAKIAPDRFGLIGDFIALIGVIIIMFWPQV
jgi:small multidrug resistance family-3 protein